MESQEPEETNPSDVFDAEIALRDYELEELSRALLDSRRKESALRQYTEALEKLVCPNVAAVIRSLLPQW